MSPHPTTESRIHAALASDVRYGGVYALAALVAIWGAPVLALLHAAVVRPVVLSNIYITLAGVLWIVGDHMRGKSVRAVLAGKDGRRTFVHSLLYGAVALGLLVNVVAAFVGALGGWVRCIGTTYVLMELGMRVAMEREALSLTRDPVEGGDDLKSLRKRLVVAQLEAALFAPPLAALMTAIIPAPVGGLPVWTRPHAGGTAALVVAMAAGLSARLLSDLPAVLPLPREHVLLGTLVRPGSAGYTVLLLRHGIDLRTAGWGGISSPLTVNVETAGVLVEKPEKALVSPASPPSPAPDSSPAEDRHPLSDADRAWLDTFYYSNLYRATFQLVWFWVSIHFRTAAQYATPAMLLLAPVAGRWWKRAKMHIWTDVCITFLLVLGMDAAGAMLEHLQDGRSWGNVRRVEANLIAALFLYKLPVRFGTCLGLVARSGSGRFLSHVKKADWLGPVVFGMMFKDIALPALMVPLTGASPDLQEDTSRYMAFAAGMTVYAALTAGLLARILDMYVAIVMLPPDEDVVALRDLDDVEGLRVLGITNALELDLPPTVDE